MQLAAFYHNNFFLGHSAMLVNEGMPCYVPQKLKRHTKGKRLGTIGILIKVKGVRYLSIKGVRIKGVRSDKRCQVPFNKSKR